MPIAISVITTSNFQFRNSVMKAPISKVWYGTWRTDHRCIEWSAGSCLNCRWRHQSPAYPQPSTWTKTRCSTYRYPLNFHLKWFLQWKLYEAYCPVIKCHFSLLIHLLVQYEYSTHLSLSLIKSLHSVNLRSHYNYSIPPVAYWHRHTYTFKSIVRRSQIQPSITPSTTNPFDLAVASIHKFIHLHIYRSARLEFRIRWSAPTVAEMTHKNSEEISCF